MTHFIHQTNKIWGAFAASLLLYLAYSANALATEVNIGKLQPWQTYDLIDHKEKGFKISELPKKYVLINFTFTDCVVYCSTQTRSLLSLHQILSEKIGEQNFEMISISLMPDRDTPKDMGNFAKRFSAENIANWHFSVSKPEQVANIMEALGAKIAKGKAAGQINHTTDIYLLDTHNNHISTFQGVPVDENDIASAITSAI